MAKGEDLQKPKKGGMVIVIGVGAKPKKKGDVKKAEEGDAPRRQRRRRNRGGPRATLRRLYSRLRNEKERTGTNIDAFLEKRKIDPEEFYGEFRRRTGEDFDDYLKGGKDKFDVQGLLNELGTKAFEERKAKAIERQSGAGKQKRTQENIYYGLLNTPVKLLRRKGIDPDRFRRAVQRMKDKGEKVDSNTFNTLITRFSDEDAARDYKELPDEAFRLTPRGPDKSDHQEVQDHEYRTMRRILSALSEQYGEEAIDAMARRYAVEGITGAPVGLDRSNIKDRDVSVFGQPSTVFTNPRAAPDTRLSSPQEEEYEGVTFDPRSKDIRGDTRQHREFIMRALSTETINVMDEAFALLKGNPSMRDAQGKAINHPAAMVYDDISSQINEDMFNPYDRPSATEPIIDDVAAREMEKLRGKTAERGLRYKYGRFERRKEDGPRARHFGVKGRKMPRRSVAGVKIPEEEMLEAKQRDRKSEEKAQKIRQFARERTSQLMNEPDQAAGPNFGIQVSNPNEIEGAKKFDRYDLEQGDSVLG